MVASVLVVEDYADLRSAIATALVKGDYACEQAVSPADAIYHLRAHHYDAILLSPTMPVASDPVMLFLRENQPDELQKVILMSDAVSDDYPTLVKPFGKAQLLSKLPHA